MAVQWNPAPNDVSSTFAPGLIRPAFSASHKADASFEDIQYQVYVLDEIRRGSDEIERGEGLGQEDVKRRLARWLEK